MVKCCVFFVVRTEHLNITQTSCSFKGLLAESYCFVAPSNYGNEATVQTAIDYTDVIFVHVLPQDITSKFTVLLSVLLWEK
jgi:hypothetical protein